MKEDDGGLDCFVADSSPLPPTGSGALDGTRVAVKDVFAVEGRVSSFGHPRWRATHSPSLQTASVVRRMLSAGACGAGITKMDQLAYSLIGNVGEGIPPKNSFDPSCFSGGSSSGSASAVAGGLADIGLGTDTAGSIRVPAAASGLYGLRTTHARVSKDGVLPLAPSLDVVGILARDPKVLRTAYFATSPSEMTIGEIRRVLLPRDLVGPLHEYNGSAMQLLARAISELLQVPIEPVSVTQFISAEVGDLFAKLQGREIWAQHSAWICDNIDSLATDVQTRLRRCESWANESNTLVQADNQMRSEYVRQLTETLDGAVLVLPVIPRRGPLTAWSEEELLAFRGECFRLTAPSSLSGAPQVVARVAGNHLTTAVSIMGARGSDEALLDLICDLSNDECVVPLTGS